MSMWSYIISGHVVIFKHFYQTCYCTRFNPDLQLQYFNDNKSKQIKNNVHLNLNVLSGITGTVQPRLFYKQVNYLCSYLK